MADRTLPWQRLERAYYADDDLVLARRESGLIAEVLFTRFLAHGKPIRAVQGAEGEVLASVLGFDPDDAPIISLVLDWFVQNGTIKAKRNPGRVAEGKARIIVFDLTNRPKYRPPDRLLTRSDRGSIDSKPQVDGAAERDASSRDPSHDPSPYGRTGTDEPTSEGAAKRGSRKPDPIFEALVSAMGWSLDGLTAAERGKLNAAAKQLRGVEATPEDIVQRADTYRRKWPDWECTPNAIASHWSDLAVGTSTNDDPVARRRAKLAVELPEALRADFGDRADEMASKTLERFPDGDLDFLERIARRDYGDNDEARDGAA